MLSSREEHSAEGMLEGWRVGGLEEGLWLRDAIGAEEGGGEMLSRLL